MPAVICITELTARISDAGHSDDGLSMMRWLPEDTDRLGASAHLAAEHERTEFTADASNLLLSSLDVDPVIGSDRDGRSRCARSVPIG